MLNPTTFTGDPKTLAVQSTAPALISADPLDRFLQSLPKEALFDGSKCLSTPERVVFNVEYTYKGGLVFQSFIQIGGEK